jgi:hypothetical protein
MHDRRAIVLLEGLGQLKNAMILSGIETRDLTACSIMPQPTTLPRAPRTGLYRVKIRGQLYTFVTFTILHVYITYTRSVSVVFARSICER